MSWLGALGNAMRERADKTLEERKKEEQQQQMQQALTQLLVGAPKFEPQTTLGPQTTELKQGGNILWDTNERYKKGAPTYPNAMMDPARAQAYAQLGAQNPNIASGLVASTLKDNQAETLGIPTEMWNRLSPEQRQAAIQHKLGIGPGGDLKPKDKYIETDAGLVDISGDTPRLVMPNPTGGDSLDMKDRIEGENKLRDDFESGQKDFYKVRDSFKRIEQAARESNAAGDIALIFNYMKMLDPGSVVRESEFATVENSQGVPDLIRTLYNKTLQGQRLAPNFRSQIVRLADSLYKGQVDTFERERQRYAGIAERYGLDPRNVIGSAGYTPTTQLDNKPTATVEQIQNMSFDALQRLDPSKLSTEELEAVVQREMELSGQ